VDEAIAFYRHLADRFGVTTVSLFTGPLHNPDRSVFYDQYTRHGSFIATPEQWAAQVRCMRDPADGLKDLPRRFAFETHMAYLRDTGEATLKLVKKIGWPWARVDPDYANLTSFEQKPGLGEATTALKGHLDNVHLKNMIKLYGTRAGSSRAWATERSTTVSSCSGAPGTRAARQVPEALCPTGPCVSRELLKDLGVS
jgi:sugar phosphate isomerase/epimerase